MFTHYYYNYLLIFIIIIIIIMIIKVIVLLMYFKTIIKPDSFHFIIIINFNDAINLYFNNYFKLVIFIINNYHISIYLIYYVINNILYFINIFKYVL